MVARFVSGLAVCAFAAGGAVAQDWGGAYAGLGLTYQSGRTAAPWFFPPGVLFGDDSHSLRGAGLRFVGGYNMQSGNLVWGPEIGIGQGRVRGDDGFNSGFENGTRMRTQVYLAGRVGAASGNTLFYGSLGWSMQSAQLTEVQVPGGPVTATRNVSHGGPRLAVGAEFMLGSGGALRLEVDHVRYNSRLATFPTYDIQSRPRLTGASVSYLFRF